MDILKTTNFYLKMYLRKRVESLNMALFRFPYELNATLDLGEKKCVIWSRKSTMTFCLLKQNASQTSEQASGKALLDFIWKMIVISEGTIFYRFS